VTELEHSSNFAKRLTETAQALGVVDRTAFVSDGVSFTNAEVFDGVRHAAAVLAENGVRAGNSVLLVLPDGIDLIRIFLGAMWLGAIPVPAHFELHAAEIDQVTDITRPSLIVRTDGLTSGVGVPTLSLDEFWTSTASPVPAAVCEPDTPGFALLTSGTTGAPKLCVHRHGDADLFQEAFGGPFLKLTEHDVSYSVSRSNFSYGLINSLFFPQLSGSRAVLTARRPTPEEALEVIRETGVTVFYGQPSFFARLVTTPGHEVLDRVRVAVVGGEPVSPTLEVRLREVLGDKLIQVLGSTEVGHAYACTPPGEARPGWVGRVLPPYRVRIVDDDGAPVPPMVEGRLQVAGESIAPGVVHFGAPENPDPEGWWSSGDAAVMAEDGFLRVLGRADDIEIVGGVNIHPVEIENVLAEHPFVVEAAVCCVRTGARPTRLRAFVVLKENAPDPQTVSAELTAEVSRRLTWYKVPEDVVFVTELPRTPIGKLNRRLLREIAGNEAA
jgi:4-hydroxybenzoate adenylyltransferase